MMPLGQLQEYERAEVVEVKTGMNLAELSTLSTEKRGRGDSRRGGEMNKIVIEERKERSSRGTTW